jgi:hypothetical protein
LTAVNLVTDYPYYEVPSLLFPSRYCTPPAGGEDMFFAGTTASWMFGANAIGIARFSEAGQLDAGFGTAGVAAEMRPASTNYNALRAMAGFPDSSLVMFGDDGGQAIAAKYAWDGTPVAAFGDAGMTVFNVFRNGDPSYFDYGAKSAWVEVLDGGLVLGGLSSNLGHFWGLARFDAGGDPDVTFADAGRFVLPWQDTDGALRSVMNDGLVQPDGAVVMVGAVSSAYNAEYPKMLDATLIRLLPTPAQAGR